MEESSEKRRERLKAMREEASIENDDEDRGGFRSTIPLDPPSLPLPSDLQQQQQPAASSPSRRFEFYTDPLAAFSGSQKKKKSKNMGSPFGGDPSTPAPPCKSPPSPFWQPDFSGFNPNLRPSGNPNTPGFPNSYLNLPPPGSFSTPNANSNPSPHHSSTGKFYPGNWSNSNPNHSSNSSPHLARTKFTPNSSPPGGFRTPGSADFNPRVTLQGGYSNPSPSAHGSWSAYGSQQPPSASQMYEGSGSGGPFMNTPGPAQYNQGRSRNNGWSPIGMNNSRSQGSNCSQGSYMQSPSSTGRDNRTPGRSGGRGAQRISNDVSALTHPELFAKRSMLVDPWKDLVPVRIESVAFRLNSCSAVTSRDWLPKSVSKASPNAKGVTVSSSGPSLAESLAASFADVISGEDGA